MFPGNRPREPCLIWQSPDLANSQHMETMVETEANMEEGFSI